MRNWIMMFLVFLMMGMTGCTSLEPQPTQPEPPGLVFQYNGVEIAMAAQAAPVLEALGEPKSCTEEPSCLFEGMDKTYYYGSFYMVTSPAPDGERIYSLWFADDSVETPEGIAIGDETAEVIEAYETNQSYDRETCGEIYFYDQGNTRLNIVTRKGTVTAVQYVAVQE